MNTIQQLLTVIVLFIAIIYTDAKADALIDRTGQRRHGLESFNQFLWACFAVFTMYYQPFKIWELAILFATLRFNLFDPIYNVTKRETLFYVGTNKALYTRIMKSIERIHPILVPVSKMATMAIGIYLIVKY